MKSPSNFERLVLGSIDSYDSDQIVILQHFSRSTIFAFFCTLFSKVEKPWKTHLKDLPNAAAFAAKAAGQNQGCRKMDIQVIMRKDGSA